MKITFLVPSTARTIGGVISLYEFANGLSRRGHGVNVVHLPVVDGHIESLDDISWFPFEPGVEHQVVRSFDELRVPEADFVEMTALRFFEGAWSDEAARAVGPAAGLPFLFVQAYQFLPPATEARAISTPGPKICIAKWMMEAIRHDGVPAEHIEFVPYGLDHSTYRLTRPIAGRPPHVSMLYNAHPAKGVRFGLAAIEEVQRRMPGVGATVFGNKDPSHPIPPGINFVRSPPRRQLVEDIYNASRVFVCSSVQEGFGFCAIEAMAGGCALVTTANGGSDEYAIPGESALVCAPRDAAALADRIERLLRDEQLATRIATRGSELVGRFDWDESARRLEAVLTRYADDPGRYGLSR